MKRTIRAETRILAKAFDLGRARARRQTITLPLELRFVRGMIRGQGGEYRVIRNQHPKLRSLAEIEVPTAVCREILRLAGAEIDLGRWIDSRPGDVGYHVFMFERTPGPKIRTLLYDHVLDRVISDPHREMETLARTYDLGEIGAPRLEGSRHGQIYRRIVDFERGAVVIDRDHPEEMTVQLPSGSDRR